MTNLLNAPLATNLFVEDIKCDELNNKLFGMGVFPQAPVTILYRNKDLIKIICSATRIALSSDIAARINIIE